MTEPKTVGRPQKQYEDRENLLVDSLVDALLPDFMKLVDLKRNARRDGVGRGTSKIKGWKLLAQQTIPVFMEKYDSPNTWWSQKNELHSKLVLEIKRRAKEDSNYYANEASLITIANNYAKYLTDHFMPYKKKINLEYKEKVRERRSDENLVTVDMTEALNKAHSVLIKASNIINGIDDEHPDWRDVSIALALVTGRRMSEIHYSAEFKPFEDDDHKVWFKGQLKAKKRTVIYDERFKTIKEVPPGDGGLSVEEIWFPIPTLVPADLAIDGLKFLQTNGKRISKNEPVRTVNSRYSTVLAKRMGEGWVFAGDDTTYHKTRAVYFRLCIVNNPTDAFKVNEFMINTLGDIDVNSHEAYMRYIIAENTLTII